MPIKQKLVMCNAYYQIIDNLRIIIDYIDVDVRQSVKAITQRTTITASYKLRGSIIVIYSIKTVFEAYLTFDTSWAFFLCEGFAWSVLIRFVEFIDRLNHEIVNDL